MTLSNISPELILRATALKEGFDDREIRKLVRQGRWQSIRRGAYAKSALGVDLDRIERHRLLCMATLPLFADSTVVSHITAAVMHGLDVWAVDLRGLHVSRNRSSGGHRSPGMHDHPTRMSARDQLNINGVAVTAADRTVVDLARTLPFEQAVVVGDSALRLGLVTRDALAEQLAAARGRHGCSAARRVLLFIDGRSESVGESRSRVAFARAGLPPPDLQRSVTDAAGSPLGRVDFWYQDLRVVGEFDGRVKYGRGLPAGQDPGEVVFAEKRREDALRDAGCEVVRWVWAELDQFGGVVQRVVRARERASRWRGI